MEALHQKELAIFSPRVSPSISMHKDKMKTTIRGGPQAFAKLAIWLVDCCSQPDILNASVHLPQGSAGTQYPKYKLEMS